VPAELIAGAAARRCRAAGYQTLNRGGIGGALAVGRSRHASRADIAQALRAAPSGLSVLDPAVQVRLLAVASAHPDHGPSRKLPDDLPDRLTRREAEILRMISEGMTNPGITAQRQSSQTVTYPAQDHSGKRHRCGIDVTGAASLRR
jgi:hypothetical protein